jgi:hypothetical protein
LFGCAAGADENKKPVPSGVAAVVGDRTITIEELDAVASVNNRAAYQALYDARRQALDQMIVEMLIGEQAAAEGITSEDLIRREVEAKATPVGDADVESFFKQNEARMRGQSLAEVGPQIRTYLEKQNADQARLAYISKVKAGAEIAIALEVPRIEVAVASNDPYIGSADAQVVIVEFSDFQ